LDKKREVGTRWDCQRTRSGVKIKMRTPHLSAGCRKQETGVPIICVLDRRCRVTSYLRSDAESIDLKTALPYCCVPETDLGDRDSRNRNHGGQHEASAIRRNAAYAL
jgi:hypothetical protein